MINFPARPKGREGYLLPVNTTEFQIIQGYCGPHSHKKFQINQGMPMQDDRFCLDFAVEVGSEVIASKAGEVVAAVDLIDSYYDGLDPNIGLKKWVNMIYIKHEDDTYTLYSHLGQNKLFVEKGQEVDQGEIIALTGLSGWVGPKPHLHFAALKARILSDMGGILARDTFPVEFDNYSGLLFDEDIRAMNEYLL